MTIYEIERILRRGDKGEDVKALQRWLEDHGHFKGTPLGNFFDLTEEAVKDFQIKYDLVVDGEVGPQTLGKMYELDRQEVPTPGARPVNPALVEARKYAGLKESSSTLQKKLVPYWKRVGLPNYKTLVGASFAWCALFFFAMNSDVGQDVIASAGAKRIGQSGYEINWKQDGIPEGAGVWKNSKSCSSSTGNHVTWADGDCSAKDIMKPGATWPGFGGNQADMVKRSIYCAKGDCAGSKDVICRVFWHDDKLPPPVKVSKNCTGPVSGAESTR